METQMGYLPYIQVILAVLLAALVLLQRSEAGLGAGFGSEGFSASRFERRGFEKRLFQMTVVVATLFVISTLLPLLLT